MIFRQNVTQLGVYNLKDENEEWTERKIAKISIHPEFDRNSEAAYNDVAVLTLEEPVVFSNDIRPVCLPEISNDSDHLAGAAVSISGWGNTDQQADGPSDTLQTAHIQIYNQRYCNKLRKEPKFVNIYLDDYLCLRLSMQYML